MDENELFKCATHAYFDWCKDHGIRPQQPSYGSTEFLYHGNDEVEIILGDVTGPLARYRWDGRHLIRQEREDEEHAA